MPRPWQEALGDFMAFMFLVFLRRVLPNLKFKRDNTPDNYGSLFDDSEVVLFFDFSWGVTP